jgi:hypothetical protein
MTPNIEEIHFVGIGSNRHDILAPDGFLKCFPKLKSVFLNLVERCSSMSSQKCGNIVSHRLDICSKLLLNCPNLKSYGYSQNSKIVRLDGYISVLRSQGLKNSKSHSAVLVESAHSSEQGSSPRKKRKFLMTL